MSYARQEHWPGDEPPAAAGGMWADSPPTPPWSAEVAPELIPPPGPHAHETPVVVVALHHPEFGLLTCGYTLFGELVQTGGAECRQDWKVSRRRGPSRLDELQAQLRASLDCLLELPSSHPYRRLLLGISRPHDLPSVRHRQVRPFVCFLLGLCELSEGATRPFGEGSARSSRGGVVRNVLIHCVSVDCEPTLPPVNELLGRCVEAQAARIEAGTAPWPRLRRPQPMCLSVGPRRNERSPDHRRRDQARTFRTSLNRIRRAVTACLPWLLDESFRPPGASRPPTQIVITLEYRFKAVIDLVRSLATGEIARPSRPRGYAAKGHPIASLHANEAETWYVLWAVLILTRGVGVPIPALRTITGSDVVDLGEHGVWVRVRLHPSDAPLASTDLSPWAALPEEGDTVWWVPVLARFADDLLMLASRRPRLPLAWPEGADDDPAIVTAKMRTRIRDALRRQGFTFEAPLLLGLLENWLIEQCLRGVPAPMLLNVCRIPMMRLYLTMSATWPVTRWNAGEIADALGATRDGDDKSAEGEVAAFVESATGLTGYRRRPRRKRAST